jgi:hypothetical protein
MGVLRAMMDPCLIVWEYCRPRIVRRTSSSIWGRSESTQGRSKFLHAALFASEIPIRSGSG